jgi:hypothetical protein
LVVVGPALRCRRRWPTTLLFSWKMRHAHRAALADLRLDAQRHADVLALDGLERVGVAPVPVLVNWPVMKGTFLPTTILASSLSSVIRLGVERMLVVDCVCSSRRWRPAR